MRRGANQGRGGRLRAAKCAAGTGHGNAPASPSLSVSTKGVSGLCRTRHHDRVPPHGSTQYAEDVVCGEDCLKRARLCLSVLLKAAFGRKMKAAAPSTQPLTFSLIRTASSRPSYLSLSSS